MSDPHPNPGRQSHQMQSRLLGSVPIPVNASSVTDIFANQLRMGVTVTDFTLVFGVAEGGATGPAVAVDRAAIHLAPGMLKQLLFHIKMAVEAYEEAVGPVNVPRRLPEHMSEMKTSLVTLLRQQMEGTPMAANPSRAPG